MTDHDRFAQAYAEFRRLCSPAVTPGLQRIRALLAELQLPEAAAPKSTIHVGGTNGKGSVCVLLEAILRAAGERTALYSSPHLHDFRERFRVDGEIMPESAYPLLEQVNAALTRLRASGAPQPTEFEAATALALAYFRAQAPDWRLWEVGLGGRFDATNVIDAPLAVITNVGRDHMDFLGETIAEIAWEKAGIIKPGATVFTGAGGPALPLIQRTCDQQQARLYVLGPNIQFTPKQHGESGQTFDLETPLRRYNDLQLGLLGAHQLANAALAVACAEAAGADEAAIRRGLSAARHPARLEILSREPLVVLDGAHNAPGMQVLAQAVRDYWPGKRVLALVGMLADKEREAALGALLPLLSGAVVSRAPLLHRSADWARLAEVCRAGGLDLPPANVVEDISAACARALELLPAYDMLLVCGSLYLVAEARAALLSLLGGSQC